MSTKIKIKCDHCGQIFIREIGRFNEAKKFDWNQYCSKKCQNENKYKRVYMSCGNLNCDKKVFRLQNQFKKSKSKKVLGSGQGQVMT